jgi:late competence protein required for DNA uptake (superfamily II DNA/RNA helicase)
VGITFPDVQVVVLVGNTLLDVQDVLVGKGARVGYALDEVHVVVDFW